LKNGTRKEKLSDPEEQVRLERFLKLTSIYQYEPKYIGLEVEMPKRIPNQFADLVVYTTDGSVYFVIEFKKANITDNEFEQAVKQGIGNGRVLGAKYYGAIAGQTTRFFEQ
jgi:type I restriction enzyme M protein